MFNMTLTEPAEVKALIQIKKEDWRLGLVTDMAGVKWDFWGIFKVNSKKFVWEAKQEDVHPYFSGTT